MDEQLVVPYKYFKPRNDFENVSNMDEYLKLLTDMTRANNDKEYKLAADKYKQLITLNLYHPYEDIEKLRYYIGTNNKKEVKKFTKSGYLSDEFNDDDAYVKLFIAIAFHFLEEEKNAINILIGLYNRNYRNFYLTYTLAEIEGLINKNYERAIALIDINKPVCRAQEENYMQLRSYVYERHIAECMEFINNGIYYDRYPGFKLILHIGECLAGIEKYDAAIDFLKQYNPAIEFKVDYYNLFMKCSIEIKNYDMAYEAAIRVEELINNPSYINQYIAADKLKRCREKVHLTKAKCFYSANNLTEAIKNYIAAARNTNISKSFCQYMKNAVEIAMKQEEYTEALDYAISAAEIVPNDYDILLLKQEADKKLGRSLDVYEDMKQLTRIRPNELKPYLNAITALYDTGNYKEMLEVYKELQINDIAQTAKILLYKVKIIYKAYRVTKENAAESLKILEKIKGLYDENLKLCDLDDEDVKYIYYYTAKAYYCLGDYDKSLEGFDKIIQEEPAMLAPYFDRAKIEVKLGKMENALADLKRVEAEFIDDGDFNYYLSRCNYALSNYNDAIYYMNRAITLGADYEDMHYIIASAYSSKYSMTLVEEDYGFAEHYYRKQLQISNIDFYKKECVKFYLKYGDIDKAIIVLNTVGYQDAEYHKLLARIYEKQKKYEQAIESYENSIAISPDYDTYNGLLQIYRELGNKSKVVEVANKMIELFPSERNELHILIGKLYASVNEYDKADKEYDNITDAESRVLHKINIAFASKDIGKINEYVSEVEETSTFACLANIYLEIGKAYVSYLLDFETSTKYMEKACNLADTVTRKDVIYLGLDYYMTSNHIGAMQVARQLKASIEKDYPDMTEEEYIVNRSNKENAPIEYGAIYLFNGNTKKAREYFEMETENAEGYIYNALMYLKIQNYELAQQYAKKALNIENDNILANTLFQYILHKNN